MPAKISSIIHTYNSEEKLGLTLKSIQDWVDEIIIIDMGSTDKTLTIVKQFKAKVYQVPYQRYADPARNFGFSKVKGDWILMIDSDESASKSLLQRLDKVVKNNEADFVSLPIKNIIFGQWIKHTRWWPDYQIRFFKTGKLKWPAKLHAKPITQGQGLVLPAKGKYSLVHHHYDSIEAFINRLNRYTSIAADELENNFSIPAMLGAGGDEFFSRYFLGQGYLDETHGLVLSVLQAFSEMVVKMKQWQKQGFKTDLDQPATIRTMEKIIKDWRFWLLDWQIKQTKNPLTKLGLKLKKALV